MIRSPLAQLRRRLTTWYVVTFSAILLLLGTGLFLSIRRQFSTELDASLRLATAELKRAAAIREREAGLQGAVVDAIDELHIPDRALYLLQVDGSPIRPASADPWIRDAARRAAREGELDMDRATGSDRMLRLHADRFTLPSGADLVAIAVADKVELEDRYASLIAAFGAAALAALLLVAAAGRLLVGQATTPIELSIEQMRRFMADAAHELRTPLGVLRSRAEVALQQPRDTAGYVAALSRIESESVRLARIVDDLMTLARAESDPRPVERSRIFLDDIVLDAVDAVRTVASVHGIAIEIGEFEEAVVDADPHLIRQLIMILLDNAIKFAPGGSTVVVRVGRDHGAAVLTVTDHGPGIPADQLPHVFERFYRGDPARERIVGATGGSGLGLSIAKWIADVHDAKLTLVGGTPNGLIATLRCPPADALPPASLSSS
ncbi:MAG: ATP-binding protein [Gemmatimonadales bacterium]